MLAFVALEKVTDWSIVIAVLVVVAFLSLTLGFVLGQLQERLAWSKLVSDGKIPTPDTTAVLKPRKAIEVVFNRTVKGFYVRHALFPQIWSRAKYKEAALGRLLMYHPDVFGFVYQDGPDLDESEQPAAGMFVGDHDD